MSTFTRTTVRLSIREPSGIAYAEVSGLAVAAYPDLVVTKGYKCSDIWWVTHAPTGRTVMWSLYRQGDAKRAALAIADALIAAEVRVDTTDEYEAARRMQAVPAAMAVIQAVR